MTTSIIIPVYNLARYIGEALDSIRAQTDPDWEAIVVDDCSTDDSRSVVQRYIELHQDPRIRQIWPEKNSGVSAARNLGVSHSRGEWLAFLDGDDLYERDFLKYMRHAAVHYGAGLVHCNAILWDGRRGGVGTYKPYWFDRLWFPKTLCTRNYITPGMMLISRQAWETVGCFDSIRLHEDWDWNLRAAYAGISFHHLPRLLVRWRKHGASASSQLYKQYRRTRHLIRKHATEPLFASMKRRVRLTALRDFAYYIARSQPDRALRLYAKTIRLQPLYLPGYVRWLAAWMLSRGVESLTPRALRFPLPASD